ncbi:MAG TPA: DUF4350 domain-containing protein [Candidatus Dormibacteraeota bacterium]|nr:DUF4350 domain-containing protein [Candidatus Dormibacteraeota bacterium]
MRGHRGWIIIGAAAIVIAVAAYVLQPRNDSPEHSSNSDAAKGTSAALLFAEAMGHPTDQLIAGFHSPKSFSTMFVFSPTSPYTADEADELRQWVSARGGVLVYASEQGDEELDRAFQVTRLPFAVQGSPYAALPALSGVAQVSGDTGIVPLDPAPSQVPILRTAEGATAGFMQKIGLGMLIVLADPLVLCNGYLEKADNGLLLADLIGADSAAPVTFDEYHHGLTVSDFSPQAWLTTPWGAAILWLLIAVFFGLLLRGRRFGPLVERAPEVARSDVEWSRAVGQLLRRSSARAVTLGLLANATERAVATRTGLPLHPREQFWQALWVRAPEVANELSEVEGTLASSSAGERELLSAARRLHEIAHPAPPAMRR